MSVRVVRRASGAPPDALAAGIHPVLARIYAARAVRERAELDYSLQRLAPFETLSGIEPAVELLLDALRADRRILVVGDFDADGATACTVGVRGLRMLGARQVDYLVPNRFEFGYGLTPEIVEVAAARDPALLVTVDNGVSSLSGVAAARAKGLRVLVTDHHLPGAVLPQADALVNPNCPGDAFPSKHLAGVGVIFYVLIALRARLRDAGWFRDRDEPRLADLLDLVALGTVADVVALDHNNRVLVAQGLARIRAGRAQPGVQALLEVAGRDPRAAVASDLAFAAGPRLNAAGRLSDISLGIECLLSDDVARARELAERLDQMNRERRELEASMQAEARAHVDALATLGDGELPFGLCLFDETWHPGIVGLVAGRMRERTHRPVIAFAPSEGGEIRGSARSVPGLHVRDVLDAVAAHNPGLLSRFGGHAMAAGLSLARRDLDAFRAAFDAEVRARLDAEELRGTVHTDGELGPAELALSFAELLREAGPWGQAFPEPSFDGGFRVRGRRIVGGRHVRLELEPAQAPGAVQGIAFNHDGDGLDPGAQVRLVYHLEVNEYRGRRSAQLRVTHVLR